MADVLVKATALLGTQQLAGIVGGNIGESGAAAVLSTPHSHNNESVLGHVTFNGTALVAAGDAAPQADAAPSTPNAGIKAEAGTPGKTPKSNKRQGK